MNNDFNFWEKYLNELKYKILELCNNKKHLYIDFHIHSNYSSDGKQTIKEILETTKSKGFDIISITDHDQIKAYDELFEVLKDGFTSPLIVPGIEFTIDNREYGNQCHFLQLFVNPKDSDFNNDVSKNYNATFNRSRIQFKRLKENKAMSEIIKKYKIKISYSDYIQYLKRKELDPEYDTLCQYLMKKLTAKNITTFDILDLLEEYNDEDIFKDRQKYKSNRYKKLRTKYKQKIDDNNPRFLLSMLAVKEVDDDWWDGEPCGSLSVNSYGQMKIEELNKKYPIYFAHPNQKKFNIVEKIIDNNKKIIGMEANFRNDTLNIEEFNNFLDKKKLVKIVGSDSHDSTMIFYDDINFYKIKSEDIRRLVGGDHLGKD